MTEAEAAQHPNPYLTVQLHAEFRSPRHRTIMMPGFWDGGRRMVILAGDRNHLTRVFPERDQRDRYIKYGAARCSGLNCREWRS